MLLLNFMFIFLTIFVLIINGDIILPGSQGVIRNVTNFRDIDQLQSADGKIYTRYRSEVGEKDVGKVYGTQNDHNELWETLKKELSNKYPTIERPTHINPPTRQNTAGQNQRSRNTNNVRYDERREHTQRNQSSTTNNRQRNEGSVDELSEKNRGRESDHIPQNQSPKNNGQKTFQAADRPNNGYGQTGEAQYNSLSQNNGQTSPQSVDQVRQNNGHGRNDETQYNRSSQNKGQTTPQSGYERNGETQYSWSSSQNNGQKNNQPRQYQETQTHITYSFQPHRSYVPTISKLSPYRGYN